MRRTAISGHGLIGEGQAYEYVERYDGDSRGRWVTIRSGDRFTGVGRCLCGATSPVLPSTAARRRWHNGHKDRIRGSLTEAQVCGEIIDNALAGQPFLVFPAVPEGTEA